jgi:ABC-type antimicrobial peptide transport system permease subunit
VKMRGLVEGEGARVGTYYMPYAQRPSRGVALAIRTAGDPIAATTAVQRALASIDPEAQLTDTFTMSDRVEKSLNPRRVPMLLSMAFGVVALLLASIGIYGVLAYQVAQRTREIGIRMALGSGTREVMQMVLREGLALVAVGLAVGAALALLLRGYIASQLYGVGALEPTVVLGVTGVLALASLLACLGPARRAASVNPIIALSRQ